MTELSSIAAILIGKVSERNPAISLTQLAWTTCGVTNFIVILFVCISLEDIVDRVVGNVMLVG